MRDRGWSHTTTCARCVATTEQWRPEPWSAALAGLVALSIAFVVVALACLAFGVWLVRREGASALRDAAPFLSAIPPFWGRRQR